MKIVERRRPWTAGERPYRAISVFKAERKRRL
jgi:hypothetical protein